MVKKEGFSSSQKPSIPDSPIGLFEPMPEVIKNVESRVVEKSPDWNKNEIISVHSDILLKSLEKNKKIGSESKKRNTVPAKIEMEQLL